MPVVNFRPGHGTRDTQFLDDPGHSGTVGKPTVGSMTGGARTTTVTATHGPVKSSVSSF